MRILLALIKRLCAISMLLIVLASCNNLGNGTQNRDSKIMVFAAASLGNVMHEIIDSFETKYNYKVTINLASSGTLARQIEQGGEPDIYLSANKSWAHYIDSLGFVKQNLKCEIAKNELVLIAPLNSSLTNLNIDSALNIKPLLICGRLAMGDPQHVPVGKYAKQSLEYYGFYESIKTNVLPTKDAPTALMVVEMGEVPLGIVFSTDAKSSQKVKTLAKFPNCSHNNISYVASVCKNNKASLLFYEFLNSDETKPIWIKFGFIK